MYKELKNLKKEKEYDYHLISDMNRKLVELADESNKYKQKLKKIEILINSWNYEAVKESRAFGYMIEIEQVLKDEVAE